jgi:MFS family permease
VERLRESMRAFRSALGNPAIRRLELAWAGANLGTWAYAVGVTVFAFQEGGARAVGLVGFGRWGAASLLAPWLSLLADRHPRRLVMISADLVRAGSLAVAAAAVWGGWPPLIVYVLTGVVAAAASAFHPAEAALRPELVHAPEELTAANVVSSTITALGTLAGPALGGLLLATSGVGTVFAVSAGLLLWSALLVFAIRADDRPPAGSLASEPIVSAALAGFTTILRDARLRLVTGLFTAQLLVNGMLAVFVVVIAVDLLGLGSPGVGWLNAASGVGGILGALVAAALVGRRRLGSDFALGLVLFGLPLVGVALWSTTAAAVVLLALLGLGETVADVAGMTLLQRVAPAEVLARVFGVLETLILLTLALGSLLAPVLIDLLGNRGALAAAGAFLPVVVLLSLRPLTALDRVLAAPERELELLRKIPIFAPLGPPELERLAASLVRMELGAGASVVTQGDPGDRFYVLDSGRAAVEIDAERVGELEPGDFFGEIALLRDVPRTATVRVLEPATLYALDRAPFLAAVTGYAPSAEAAEQVIGARLAAGERLARA